MYEKPNVCRITPVAGEFTGFVMVFSRASEIIISPRLRVGLQGDIIEIL